MRIYSFQKKRKNGRWLIQNVVFFLVTYDMNRFKAMGCFPNFNDSVLKTVAETEWTVIGLIWTINYFDNGDIDIKCPCDKF